MARTAVLFTSREVRQVREVVAPKGTTTKTVAAAIANAIIVSSASLGLRLKSRHVASVWTVFCYGERFAMEKYNAEQCAM